MEESVMSANERRGYRIICLWKADKRLLCGVFEFINPFHVLCHINHLYLKAIHSSVSNR